MEKRQKSMEAIADIDSSATDMLNDLANELLQMGVDLWFARLRAEIYDVMALAGLIEKVGKDHFYRSIRAGVLAFHQLDKEGHEQPSPVENDTVYECSTFHRPELNLAYPPHLLQSRGHGHLPAPVARVRGMDPVGVLAGVPFVDRIIKLHARISTRPGRMTDFIPQLRCWQSLGY